MTNEKQELIEIFHELLSIVRSARDAYSELLMDENLIGKRRIVVQNLHDDKERHMEIAQEIINTLES